MSVELPPPFIQISSPQLLPQQHIGGRKKSRLMRQLALSNSMEIAINCSSLPKAETNFSRDVFHQNSCESNCFPLDAMSKTPTIEAPKNEILLIAPCKNAANEIVKRIGLL